MAELNLSVIILSFNTRDITLRCLAKLKIAKAFCEKKLNNKIKIIVIDNASSDGSADSIKSDYPWAKLITQKENTGFSKGCNIGMKESKGTFLLLLNSDVYLEEESLYKALAYFRVNMNCDVLGVRLNYSDERLQPSAGNLPTPINLIFWIFGLSLFPFISHFHPKNKAFFIKAHQVGWVMGAFLMLKRKVYETTSGFDENLFMHMEEIEWCKRIKDQGYKIWYVPQVEVVHLHGASTNFDLSASFLNELKGIKYYLKKHYNLFYPLAKLFLTVGLILRIVAFSILGKTQRAGVYLKGLAVI